MDQVEQTNEQINEQTLMLDFIKQKVPSWNTLNINEIKFEKMAFGLTSQNYKVFITEKNIEPKTLLIRKFGLHSSSGCDREMREKEIVFFDLFSQMKIGPKTYGHNLDYRVEEFINSRVIKSYEINNTKVRKSLAISLGLINSFKIDKVIDNTSFIEDFISQKQSIDACLYNVNLTTYTQERATHMKNMKYLIEKDEIEFIKRVIPKDRFVLSHNDIWVGNILIEETGRVTIIDYERIAYNFQGYDLGKLILETMFERLPDSPQHEINEKYFPTKDEIIEFCEYYLIGFRLNKAKDLDRDKAEKYTKEELIKMVYEDEKEFMQEREQLIKDTYLGMMIAGYFMAFLGLLIGPTDRYQMDFVKFGIDGHNIYLKYKQMLNLNSSN